MGFGTSWIDKDGWWGRKPIGWLEDGKEGGNRKRGACPFCFLVIDPAWAMIRIGMRPSLRFDPLVNWPNPALLGRSMKNVTVFYFLNSRLQHFLSEWRSCIMLMRFWIWLGSRIAKWGSSGDHVQNAKLYTFCCGPVSRKRIEQCCGTGATRSHIILVELEL
jgi:hypothetical protein